MLEESGAGDWSACRAALLLVLGFLGCGDAPPSPGTQSALESGGDHIALDDFAGSGACAGCHEGQYRSWSMSTHGRAGGEATARSVIAPFDGAPLVLLDATVTPQLDSLGGYQFRVRWQGGGEEVIPVDGVIGGGHLLGGGTQGFVSHRPDGTVRFLPFDYSRQLGAWFCNTGTRADRGWIPMDERLALADCGDWPPVRILGTHSRFANCQSCHGSQIAARQDPGQGVSTQWTSLDINCESCHGPARRHVSLMQAGGPDASALLDIGLPSRVVDHVDASLNTCFQCHALKDVVREGYLPGRSLTDHYALKLPILGDDPYTSDGRVRTFAYQGTHLSSSCYVDGAMTCISCHEPHGLGYWDVNRVRLDDERDDRQCTSCHASKRAQPEEHTRHPPGSEGSVCVACHMPYLQHPEVGDAVPFARSDHTIPIPRPSVDARLGIVSACRTCHEDRSEIRLQGDVERWWGQLKPLDPVSSALLAVTDQMGEDLAARMLLRPEVPGVMARFQGLARFLDGWVETGEELGAEATARVTALAASDDPDLRALALAVLHVAGPVGSALGTGTRLDVSAAVREESEAVRRRWVMILGFLSDEAAAAGRAGDAQALLRRAQMVLPGDPGVMMSLGLQHYRAGDPASAIEAFGESLAADPNQPLAHINRGISYAALGDAAAAEDAYAAALALNPGDALAHFNLGNLRLRSGNRIAAIQSYERALALAPELARAHLNVAIALAQGGRVTEALFHAERAVAFAPGDATAQRVLSDLQRGAVGHEAR